MYKKNIINLLAAQQIIVPDDAHELALVDLGLDSLRLALLILSMEQEFNLKLDIKLMKPECFYSVSSINDLILEMQKV